MHIFGKILGLFFGFSFGGPIGAMFGLFIGHRFDKARTLRNAGFDSSFGNSANQQERQSEFFKSAFAVMGHVAKAAHYLNLTSSGKTGNKCKEPTVLIYSA